MNNKLLIIEDDIDINEMLVSYLKMEGFDVDSAKDGKDGLELFIKTPYDLVILDLMLPKMSGMEVLKRIRDISEIPILILSAKDKDIDKAIGLGNGADDYIAKPFSMIEILARIKANLRRANQYSKPSKIDNGLIELNDLIIDASQFRVLKNNQDINLTYKEFQILYLFVTHPNQVFTRANIFKAVWEEEYFGDENIINVHIRRLREKIETDSSSPEYIKTLWGIGYKLGVSL